MATLHRQVIVNLSPDALWEKVADVGALSEILEVVAKSEVTGDQRSCTLGDGAALKETILGIDPKHRRVAYTITASPFPLEHHSASMQVTDAPDGRATFTWITDLKPDALAEPFGQLLDREIEQLKTRF